MNRTQGFMQRVTWSVIRRFMDLKGLTLPINEKKVSVRQIDTLLKQLKPIIPPTTPEDHAHNSILASLDLV